MIDPGYILDMHDTFCVCIHVFIVIQLEHIYIDSHGPCTCPQELNWIKSDFSRNVFKGYKEGAGKAKETSGGLGVEQSSVNAYGHK